MGDGLQFIDIILFAMVAGFILLRLRSVLGRRTGEERRPPNPYNKREPNAPEQDNVVKLPDRTQPRDGERQVQVGDGSPMSAALTQIAIADPNFDRDGFLHGARAAYEMTVEAFAKGDRDTLRMLTSPDVYEPFEAVIEDRERRGHVQETAITAMKSVEIVDASLEGSQAEVTVRFVSDTVSAVRDTDGQLVGGPAREHEVIDTWTFARDVSSRDPNWILIATGVEAD